MFNKDTMPHIIIYGTPQCSQCIQIKQWLTLKEINFVDVDVTNLPYVVKRIAREVKEFTLPVIMFEGKYLQDNKLSTLREALNIK